MMLQEIARHMIVIGLELAVIALIVWFAGMMAFVIYAIFSILAVPFRKMEQQHKGRLKWRR